MPNKSHILIAALVVGLTLPTQSLASDKLVKEFTTEIEENVRVRGTSERITYEIYQFVVYPLFVEGDKEDSKVGTPPNFCI